MRIIFHIGAGKTGTSSIQQTLFDNFNFLLSKGVLYAGRSFNSLGNDRSWKNKNLGFGLGKKEITDIYINELKKYVAYAKKHNCSTLILCNEAFSSDVSKLFTFFTYLKDNEYQLEVCYYVRGPEKWTKSAYEQWAIRHKTFNGEILPAKEYIYLKTYKKLIEPIDLLNNSRFSNSLTIVNLDKVNDAVEAFLEVYNLPSLEISSTNKSVDSTSLAFYYYLNNKVKGVASNRKGNILSNIFNEMNDIEDFQDKITVKPEYYDEEDVIEFKRFMNCFLESKDAFDLDFNLGLDSKEKLTNRELKLIKLSTELFEVVYQTYLRKEILNKIIDGKLNLSENERNELSRLSRYIENSLIG